jgi:hypothetical protein
VTAWLTHPDFRKIPTLVIPPRRDPTALDQPVRFPAHWIPFLIRLVGEIHNSKRRRTLKTESAAQNLASVSMCQTLVIEGRPLQARAATRNVRDHHASAFLPNARQLWSRKLSLPIVSFAGFL